jgi:hypothetical protein
MAIGRASRVSDGALRAALRASTCHSDPCGSGFVDIGDRRCFSTAAGDRHANVFRCHLRWVHHGGAHGDDAAVQEGGHGPWEVAEWPVARARRDDACAALGDPRCDFPWVSCDEFAEGVSEEVAPVSCDRPAPTVDECADTTSEAQIEARRVEKERIVNEWITDACALRFGGDACGSSDGAPPGCGQRTAASIGDVLGVTRVSQPAHLVALTERLHKLSLIAATQDVNCNRSHRRLGCEEADEEIFRLVALGDDILENPDFDPLTACDL